MYIFLAMLLDPILMVPMLIVGWAVRRSWWLLATPVLAWLWAAVATAMVHVGYLPDNVFLARWIAAGTAVLIGYGIRLATRRRVAPAG
jgi:hypothetical protein